MISIYKMGLDSYILETNQSKLPERSLKETAKVMYELGVSFDEIEIGFEELINKDHNYAHYGINKLFIFTEKKDEKNE